MAAVAAASKTKGPLVDPALCRCCRSIKRCRLLISEYEWSGKKEVYSDMFVDCFGLLLSHLDSENRDCCICATCVGRLREAYAFRQQVLSCEQMFLNAKLEKKQDGNYLFDVKVKAEPLVSDTEVDKDDAFADDNDSDNGLLKDDRKMTFADHHTNNESDMKLKQPLERKAKLKDIVKNTKARRGRKSDVKTKRELLGKMKKLRDKIIDQILEKPTPPPEKNPNPVKTKKKTTTDHDHMVFSNAVTIVHNSYVCPFLNRISNYYCFYCKDQFTNPLELREHTLVHNPKELFECSMENKKIPKIDITRIDCRLCSEKIDDLETFKCHITNTHGKLVYPVKNEFLKFRLTLNNLTCTECNSSFPYFDVLKKHMIDHFGTFVCDMCGACFLEQNSLRSHIKSHNKSDANFPCEICGKNLKSKYSRYLHIATVHEKKPTVNCYKCDASFLSYALRNRHLIEVHGDKRTFPCKLCDKVYNRRKTLMEHNRRNHLKVYRHQCDLCDQKFYLPSRLKEHMATHTGERNFRCEFCDKSYPRLQSLQEHIRSHSNERRYKCDLCNSAFTQNGSLKNHMKSHHQGFDVTDFN